MEKKMEVRHGPGGATMLGSWRGRRGIEATNVKVICVCPSTEKIHGPVKKAQSPATFKTPWFPAKTNRKWVKPPTPKPPGARRCVHYAKQLGRHGILGRPPLSPGAIVVALRQPFNSVSSASDQGLDRQASSPATKSRGEKMWQMTMDEE